MSIFWVKLLLVFSAFATVTSAFSLSMLFTCLLVPIPSFIPSVSFAYIVPFSSKFTAVSELQFMLSLLVKTVYLSSFVWAVMTTSSFVQFSLLDVNSIPASPVVIVSRVTSICSRVTLFPATSVIIA